MSHPPHLTPVEQSHPPAANNRLLQALSEDDQALLRPHLRLVALRRGDVMIKPDQPIEHVYFPEDALGSVVADSPDGRRIEVGLFGRDGMSSTSILLGSDRTPYGSFAQVAGSALCMGADELRHAIRRSSSLHCLLLRYVEAYNIQVAYTGVSHGSFAIEERLARWLLMSHDRLPGNDLPLVHEFLAIMLGVRRSGVTIALHILEGAGIIKANRGHIIVRNRVKLEEAAKGSYGVPEAAYRRLIGELSPWPGTPQRQIQGPALS